MKVNRKTDRKTSADKRQQENKHTDTKLAEEGGNGYTTGGAGVIHLNF